MINDLLHSFPGQDQNEAVFVFARPYPVAFLGTALIFFIVFIFSVLGQLALMNTNFFQISDTNVIGFAVLFLGIFQLATIIVFLVAVLDFYYDLIIVTDRRLIDIDQEQLFFRRIAELSLEDIEDVSSQTQGFLQDLFNYGTVEIQTAGAKDNFNIRNIHMPREVAAITLDLSEKAKRGVTEHLRLPDTSIMGVINNRAITSPGALLAAGAMQPTDMRRSPRNAFE